LNSGETLSGFKLTSDLQHAGTATVSSTTKKSKLLEGEEETRISAGLGEDDERLDDDNYDDEGSVNSGSSRSEESYDSKDDVEEDAFDSDQDSDVSDGAGSDNDIGRFTHQTEMVAPTPNVALAGPARSRAIDRKDESKKGKQRPPRVLQANSGKALKKSSGCKK
jgi:hypothetical protein